MTASELAAFELRIAMTARRARASRGRSGVSFGAEERIDYDCDAPVRLEPEVGGMAGDAGANDST